jgi:hypothetical protein
MEIQSKYVIFDTTRYNKGFCGSTHFERQSSIALMERTATNER